MSAIEPYVRTLFVRRLAKNAFPDGFIRRDDFVAQIEEAMRANLNGFDVADRIDISAVSNGMFEEMNANSMMEELADDFAGRYYRTSVVAVTNFRQTLLATDPIHTRAEAIGGDRYFKDVFQGYLSGQADEPIVGGANIAVPASDRVVKLNDNQRTSIGIPLTALIDDIQADNEILEDGVKERLIGQMKAGRELIGSGSVRAYLLYHTLLRGLLELIARYRGRAIAIAAEKLAELLVEQFFQGAVS